jgi:hypothetical protein
MDNINYVYLHKEPTTGEVVYVGKGSGGRAWDTTRNKQAMNPEHYTWMQSLMSQGYIPTDWAVILKSGLTDVEAFHMEKLYRHENGYPKYDRTSGEKNHQAKLTDVQVREIYTRSIAGESQTKIAKEFGVCRTAITMIKTRKQWKATTACLA